MEIKKFFKNRNKFVDLDTEEYNDLIQKIDFVKAHECEPSFFNKFKGLDNEINKS